MLGLLTFPVDELIELHVSVSITMEEQAAATGAAETETSLAAMVALELVLLAVELEAFPMSVLPLPCLCTAAQYHPRSRAHRALPFRSDPPLPLWAILCTASSLPKYNTPKGENDRKLPQLEQRCRKTTKVVTRDT
jgi:hypothetical protein